MCLLALHQRDHVNGTFVLYQVFTFSHGLVVSQWQRYCLACRALFEKSRKATSIFVRSVRLSISPKATTVSTWRIFMKIGIWIFFWTSHATTLLLLYGFSWKLVFDYFLKSAHNNSTSTWRIVITIGSWLLFNSTSNNSASTWRSFTKIGS